MNIDLIRSFFVIVERGSINKAAEQLRVSQSTLSRQMQVLEQEMGGPLFDRGPSGVALTAAGHGLHDQMEPLLASMEAVLADVRRKALGQSKDLRIGYLMSAATEYLNPALATLRKAHPEIKVKMIDLSPGEQIEALRHGEIDVGLIGQEGALLAKEFYLKTLAELSLVVAMPADHGLARGGPVKLSELRQTLFVGAHDRDMPGHNAWVARLGKSAGFKVRFAQNAESLTHALSLVVTEGAVILLPAYAKNLRAPGVVFKPLRDARAVWKLMVVWQRGKQSAAVKALVDALPAKK